MEACTHITILLSFVINEIGTSRSGTGRRIGNFSFFFLSKPPLKTLAFEDIESLLVCAIRNKYRAASGLTRAIMIHRLPIIQTRRFQTTVIFYKKL